MAIGVVEAASPSISLEEPQGIDNSCGVRKSITKAEAVDGRIGFCCFNANRQGLRQLGQASY